MFNKRICNKCEQKKPLTAFARDTKGKDGYAVRCKVCKTAQKALGSSKIPKQKTPTPTIQTHPSPIVRSSVPIMDERSTILDAIHEKYGATFTITVTKDRTCHINILKEGWKNTKKFRTPEELLECVL